MRIGTKLLSLAAGLALFGLGQANAQGTNSPGTNSPASNAQGANPGGGTTTGPAVGSPATLGTGGVTGATPHQTEAVRNSGGVPITAEKRGQHGGTRHTVKPGASDAGAGVHHPPQ
jgi:hypothetical protein